MTLEYLTGSREVVGSYPLFSNTDSLSNLFSNLEQSDLVFSWAENLYRTQEYSTLNTWLQNSRPYWDETENNIRIGLQSLYNILSSNLSDGELLDSLSSSQISAMVALRTNSIPYISHKVNAHLAGTTSYEQSYTEPVYLSGASKRDLNESTQRPATPETSFKLWPNPTDKMLTLQWDWMEEGLKFPLEINIYTIDGKQILTHTVEDFMKNIQVFNVQSWKKGSYVIQVRSNNMLLFSEIFQKK